MVPLIHIIAAMIAVRPDVAVSGRVLDREGKPIAGARVSWAIDWRYQEGRDTTAEADGRFALQGVTDDPIVLTVQATGRAPELKKIPSREAGKPIEVRLGPGHTIRGRVVDAFGNPIAGMPIEVARWRQSPSLRWQSITDADGRYRWDEAPADAVAIDLNRPSRNARRTLHTGPDGPEVAIRMNRTLRVRGRVTDAETRKPIKNFRLVPGGRYVNAPETWWDYDEEQQVSGLSYDVKLGPSRAIEVIRVEADGYLPAVSRPIRSDEGEAIVHFALRRGEGTSGVVRLPDGSPMADAIAILATPSRPVYLSNGRFPEHLWGPHTIVRTRADGRFQLPPHDPPFAILVLHDRGYVEADFDARPTGPIERKARPWGRIEGTLRFGSRLAPRELLRLSIPADPGIRPSRSVTWDGHATTDANGRFAFERLAEGTYLISRNVSLGAMASAGGSPSADVEVRPGATSHVDLGRAGRPVVGKAVLPAAIAGRSDRIYDFCYLVRKPITRHTTSLTFAVEPDGSFRIESIEPGTYEILIILKRRPDDGGSIGVETLASVRREFVVPPIPGGSSDEPLDLGSIRLEAPKP